MVVGSYGVGLTLATDRVPDAGETVIGRSFSTGHGGKGSNQAVAARRLGARVTLFTAVGADAFGAGARALWDDEGVEHDQVVTGTGSTMVGVILVDASGENRIAIAPGVLSDFGPQHLDRLADALADCDVLLVGLEIPLATAVAALRAGRAAGVTTVLNPAPAPLEPLEPLRARPGRPPRAEPLGGGPPGRARRRHRRPLVARRTRARRRRDRRAHPRGRRGAGPHRRTS